MKLVEHSSNIGWKVRELTWTFMKLSLHICEVILPKEYAL